MGAKSLIVRAAPTNPGTRRVRERGMRRFKSAKHVQRFLNIHAAMHNLFNLGRHLVTADHYRDLRQDAFLSREKVTVA